MYRCSLPSQDASELGSYQLREPGGSRVDGLDRSEDEPARLGSIASALHHALAFSLGCPQLVVDMRPNMLGCAWQPDPITHEVHLNLPNAYRTHGAMVVGRQLGRDNFGV